VYVEHLENGNFALQVHIADVSWYVQPGMEMDTEAQNRGTSVYFPDRAVPMLPVELSTDLCSLRPGVDRLVVSALLEITPQGETVASEFCRGVIRSAERMTYTDVWKLLEGESAATTTLRERYAPMLERFALMRDLAAILNRMRERRGSIDFALPEPLVEFDEAGDMTGVVRHPRNVAHRLIEAFMLAANEAVAAHLDAKLKAGMYRVHEMPDPKRVMEFEETALQFGYTLGVGAMPVKRFAQVERMRDGRKVRKDIVRVDEDFHVDSKRYQKLIRKLEGKPEERVVSYLLLRSLRQARYAERNLGHFALAASHYTHFTSPIRRYPDLIVHRLLLGEQMMEDTLRELADDCSFSERRAGEAERELLEWKKARFMMGRVGKDFAGMIISTTRFGFFVELADLYIEGLVPIDSLPDDRYAYQEGARRIVGQRSRRAFSIGDPVRVTLVSVDPVERRLTFALLDGEGGRKRPARKRERDGRA
jgi:ribonuclease R